MAEWIAEGEPSLDLWTWTCAASARTTAPRRTRTLGSGRPTSPTTTSATPTTSARRAGRFASRRRTRWHRSTAPPSARSPAGSGSTGTSRTPERGDESLRPRGWAGMHWSPAIGAEHLATREAAALFDESSFAKMEISGPGAAEFVEGLCDNRVARGVGQITYTQMLNSRGGIECDFTVARLAEERFSIVTGTAFGRHDRSWITSHLPRDGSVQVHDVTSAYACFGIWGPRARDILQPLVAAGPSNDAFPYMTLQDITVGHVPVRALRVTYVGELGWELYCPTEYGIGLWRALWEAGRAARHGRGRLPGDRLDAGREGLPRLGRRHHAGRDAIRGQRRLLREARQGGRLHRPRRPRGGEGARAAKAPRRDPPRATHARSPSATSRSGWAARSAAASPRAATATRSSARSPTPTCRPSTPKPAPAREIEIFGQWIEGEIAAEPLFDPKMERIKA